MIAIPKYRMLKRYLLAVESPLTEGTNYLGMFNDLIANNDTAKQAIEKYITWARSTLKKNDRIVWFLRWVRVELAGRTKHTDSDAELARLNKRLKSDFTRHDMVPINNLMTNLAHFLSMPIRQIQEVVWGKQSPQELLSQFKEMEDDWKETSNARLIDYGEGDEPKVILRFPDGYAWFDLEKFSCRHEADAMGHCGNSAAGKHGETILSLRRLVHTTNGRTNWYPVLTFILDKNGDLGEMKGRGNGKPAERYHPYIVALLKLRIIKGIKGGGYLTQNNFKMTDLDDETREELVSLKPDLADLETFYQKEGMTKRVLNRLGSALSGHGLSMGDYEPEHKRFLVEEWTDFDSFLGAIYADDLEKILKIAMGEADFQHDPDSIEQEFKDTLLELPQHWQEKIIAHAGLRGDMATHVDAIADSLIASGDDYYRKFENVYNGDEGLRTQAWERLYRYAEAGWYFACDHVYADIPTGSFQEFKDFVKNEQHVHLYIGEQDMINLATSSEDDDDEYGYQLQAMRGESSNPSWDAINDEYQSERWHDEGLIKNRSSGDTWLSGINTDTPELVQDYLAALEGQQGGGMIDDPRQQAMKFEAMRHHMNLISSLFG